MTKPIDDYLALVSLLEQAGCDCILEKYAHEAAVLRTLKLQIDYRLQKISDNEQPQISSNNDPSG